MTGQGMSDILGVIIGLVFTVMIFSYLLGDNGLFRFAIHVFIGVAAGYTLALAISYVIWPRMLALLISGNLIVFVILLVLSLLLLAKSFPRFSSLGSPVMALLAGVGAAVIVGGVVRGTLFPQIAATANLFDLQKIGASNQPALEFCNGVFILIGVIAALAYFRFHVRTPRPAISQVSVWIGQGFIAVTLGAVFAGVYAAALAALVERLDAFVGLFRWLISGM